MLDCLQNVDQNKGIARKVPWATDDALQGVLQFSYLRKKPGFNQPYEML